MVSRVLTAVAAFAGVNLAMASSLVYHGSRGAHHHHHGHQHLHRARHPEAPRPGAGVPHVRSIFMAPADNVGEAKRKLALAIGGKAGAEKK